MPGCGVTREARSCISEELAIAKRSLLPSWSHAASVYHEGLPPALGNTRRWFAASSAEVAACGLIMTTPSPRLVPTTGSVAWAPGFTTCSPQLPNHVRPLAERKMGACVFRGSPVANVNSGAASDVRDW